MLTTSINQGTIIIHFSAGTTFAAPLLGLLLIAVVMYAIRDVIRLHRIDCDMPNLLILKHTMVIIRALAWKIISIICLFALFATTLVPQTTADVLIQSYFAWILIILTLFTGVLELVVKDANNPSAETPSILSTTKD